MLGNKYFQALTVLIPSTEVWVDKARLANYTENGSIQYPFRGVQAAIDGTTGAVAIHIIPATYTEDITISRAGIHLLSHDTAQYRSGAQITGKCTVDIAVGGATYWSGVTFFNDADHTIDFIGIGDQKVFANNCAFRNDSLGAHHCWRNTNTGDSELTGHDVIIRHTDVSGGGRAFLAAAGTATFHRIWKGNIIIDDDSAIAIECLGAGSFELNHEDVQGRMVMAGTVGMDLENTRLTSLTATVLDYTSTFALGSRMRNIQVITSVSSAIIGTGTIHQSGTVWEFTGAGFDALLTIVSTPVESSRNNIYDPSASLIPLVSINVQDAIDELDGIIAGQAKAALTFGSDSVSSSTTTRYLDAGVRGLIAGTVPSLYPVTRAGTLKNFRILQSTGGGNGNDIVYNVLKNAVATGLTVTLASTSTALTEDLVNTVAVIIGDIITLQVTKALVIAGSPSNIFGTLDIE